MLTHLDNPMPLWHYIVLVRLYKLKINFDKLVIIIMIFLFYFKNSHSFLDLKEEIFLNIRRET